MKKQLVLNLENEKIEGNVLDAGFVNYGIPYLIYKHNVKEFDIEYAEREKMKEQPLKSEYDSGVLFFTFRDMLFNFNKKRLIKSMYRYLNNNGIIYIWDASKGTFKIEDLEVKVLLPENKSKNIFIKDYNVFKNNSKEKILNMVSEYFNVVTFKTYEDIFFIKGIKKGVKR